MNLALSTAVGSKTGFSSVLSSSRIIMTVPSYWVVPFVPKSRKGVSIVNFTVYSNLSLRAPVEQTQQSSFQIYGTWSSKFFLSFLVLELSFFQIIRIHYVDYSICSFGTLNVQ